jgi:N-acetylneuraminic acid mutarotase
MKKLYFLLAGLLFCYLVNAQLPSTQWTPIANLPGAGADGCISFSINGKGYVGGGTGRNSFYEYTPATNAWVQKTSIPGPSARAWSTNFSLNGKAYVVGGDSTFGGLLNDVWEYDPSTDIWTQKADFLGGARDGMFSWVIQDKVYVGGGFNGTTILNDFYQYDPSADTWIYKGVLPSPVLFAASFV